MWSFANVFLMRGLRLQAKEMVDIIADYLETVGERRVFPDVKPGYMLALVPSDAPDQADEWDNVIQDIYNVIIPGVSLISSNDVSFSNEKFHRVYGGMTELLSKVTEAFFYLVDSLAESPYARLLPCSQQSCFTAG